MARIERIKTKLRCTECICNKRDNNLVLMREINETHIGYYLECADKVVCGYRENISETEFKDYKENYTIGQKNKAKKVPIPTI